MKNSNSTLAELRSKGSVALKSREGDGIQCKGWETAVQVPGFDNGGWDAQRSRTWQGGAPNREKRVS